MCLNGYTDCLISPFPVVDFGGGGVRPEGRQERAIVTPLLVHSHALTTGVSGVSDGLPPRRRARVRPLRTADRFDLVPTTPGFRGHLVDYPQPGTMRLRVRTTEEQA
jgi:hypothetical protein